MAIEEEGLRVTAEVEDSESLLKACKETIPAFVILDLVLPEVESVRVVENILDISQRISIIVLSDPAYGTSEKLFAAGARGILQKPFTTYDLIDMLRKVKPVIQ